MWAYFLPLLIAAPLLINYLGSLDFSFLTNRTEKNYSRLAWVARGLCETGRGVHMFNAGSSHGLRAVNLLVIQWRKWWHLKVSWPSTERTQVPQSHEEGQSHRGSAVEGLVLYSSLFPEGPLKDGLWNGQCEFLLLTEEAPKFMLTFYANSQPMQI